MSDRLPSPKGVALAVTELCRREDVSLSAVVDVLKTDPALTGRLIKLANAVSHGLRPAASLQEAVTRLGLATVKQVSLGFSLMDQHRRGSCPGFDYQEFWSHSLLTAIVMKDCGGHIRLGAPDELFALGLLAQVGQLALASVLPEEYGQVLAAHRADPGRPLTELEEAQLDVDHVLVTGALLEDWGLPAALIAPVLDHEHPECSQLNPDSRAGQLLHLLNLAAHLADLGRAPEEERHRYVPEILLEGGKIGLGAEAMAGIVDKAFREWRDWSSLLRVPASVLPPFDVLTQAVTPREDAKGKSRVLRILLVDDDPAESLTIQSYLAEHCGHAIHCATDGKEALSLVLETAPQVLIANWALPDMTGLALCRTLRATEMGRHLYLLILSGKDDDDHLEEAYEAGADSYVGKPVNLRALQAALRAAWRSVHIKQEWDRDRDQLQRFATELAMANRRLEKAALTDMVTGLPNRRAAISALEQAWAATSRADRPLSLLVVDLDNFKKINDHYGHAAGDSALRRVAGAMRASARKEESVCRLGGEEFLVICPNTDLDGAASTAERLREVVARLSLSAGPQRFQVTISVGVACRDPLMSGVEALIHAADEAMYEAKHAGRNQTCVHRGNGTDTGSD